MAVRPGIETIKIKGSSPSSKSAKEFARFAEETYPAISNVEIVGTEEDAVRDCDIICIATSSPTGNIEDYPYIKECWIKPGALFCCPAAARFDDDFILHRARTIADNTMLYEAWEEEMDFPAYETIPIPAVHCMDLITEGRMKPSQIDDLGDILIGKIPTHRKNNEIIVYSIGGMPV